MKTSLIAFNKPAGVICQFSPQDNYFTLKKYINEAGFYAAGRLDASSEGLVLLTNDGYLQAKITEPKFKLPKTYLVQVEGEMDSQAIEQLSRGIRLKEFQTAPAQLIITRPPPMLWARNPAIRERKTIPTSWVSIIIKEGKNRQVRRMCAAVGFPCLRLIRIQIGKFNLFDQHLALGEWRYISPNSL